MTTNAVLVSVNGPGRVDGRGDEVAAGDSAWEGRQPGYLTRKKMLTRVGSASQGSDATMVEMDVLVLEGTPPVALIAGDQAGGQTILVEDRRTTPVTKRYRIVSFDVRAAGTPVDSTRIVLADERTP